MEGPWPKKGHFATAFGLLAARLGLPKEACLSAFAYCTVRDCLSAAVRLNLVGPLQAVGLHLGFGYKNELAESD